MTLILGILGTLLLLWIISYISYVLFPPGTFFLLKESKARFTNRLSADESAVLSLASRLRALAETLEREQFEKTNFERVTTKERDAIRYFWISVIGALMELDVIKERYKTFYQIFFVSKPTLNKRAFMIAYTAFLAQHNAILRINKEVTSKHMKTFLDGIRADRIPENSFSKFSNKLTLSKEILRLRAGRAYYKATKENLDPRLIEWADYYLENIDASSEFYEEHANKRPWLTLGRRSFSLWFPIQRGIAARASRIKATYRKFFISQEQARALAPGLQPGDIMVQRREWYATNVGISGFWTHAALYLGTLEVLCSFFDGISELKGVSFSEYFKTNFPKAYQDFLKKDEFGYPFAVIEAKRPGVIFESLETSGNADSLGVLRARKATKQDLFSVVTHSLGDYGKPYDFYFNFASDDQIMCSELVYNAYIQTKKVSLELDKFNGGLVYYPNNFVKKFDLELDSSDPDFEFVLFLDGNELLRHARPKSAAAFRKTWRRPKWHTVKTFFSKK